MVQLIRVDFFDYTFLGVVIVAIAVSILVIWLRQAIVKGKRNHSLQY